MNNKYYIVPLILNGDIKEVYDNPKNIRFWQILEKELDAKLTRVEQRINYDKPVLFLVYFDEQYENIDGDLYEIIYKVPYSASIFFYQRRPTHQLYKLSIEEEYLLNFTKDFLLYDIKSNPSIFIPQIINFCKTQLSIFSKWDRDKFKIISTNLNKNQFLLYSFLRIYREDMSEASFYACIEFILMIQQFLLLIDIAIIKNDANVFNQKILNFLKFNNTQIMDGKVYQFLIIAQNHLHKKSPSFHFLYNQIPKDSLLSLNKILEYFHLGIEDVAEPKNELNRPLKWISLFKAVKQIRDKTKGHGIIYDVSNIIEILIELCNDLLSNIPRIEIENLGTRISPKKPYMSFINIGDDFKIKLKNNLLKINYNCKGYTLNPYILYSDNYGLFLYDGLSRNDQNIIYKNYSQGINILI